MVVPVNTYDSYDMVGIREQLNETINMITPEETPFYSSCKKVDTVNTFHEWQTDALRASGVNAHIEGDDTTASARTPTVRLGNYTQIVKDAARVSGTDTALNKAGRGKELVREMLKVGKELRLDVEKALFANQARDAGTTNTAPRFFAGLPAWLTTNIDHNGTNPTGDGTNARTDGAGRALTQDMVTGVMQSAWTSGGKVETVYCSPAQVTNYAGFAGSNNQRNTVDRRELSYAVDVYMTSFGTVELMPSRECRATDMFFVQPDKFQVGVARPWTSTELAKTGDSDAEQLLTEITLISLNEAASGAIYDLS